MIYCLERIYETRLNNNLSNEVMTSCVVSAPDEETARQLAAKEALSESEETWLSPRHSTCEALTENTPTGVICYATVVVF